MSTEQIQALEKILVMSNEMLEFAQAEQWAELAQVEAKRQPLILSTIPDQPSIDAGSEAGMKILEILELDVQIHQLIQNERNATRDELADMHRAKGQVKAYEGG